MKSPTCPAPSEDLTVEQILSKTRAMSPGVWIAAIATFHGVDHIAVGVAGSTKAVAIFGPVGADDEDESVANAEMFMHAPRLRRELIALRDQESEDLERAYQMLAGIRKGMLALYDRYEALHICATRYLKEWPNEAPKGWSLDELQGCLELQLPKLIPALDPDLVCQRREDIEDWVIGCKPSLYAVVLQRLLAQSEELLQLRSNAVSEARLQMAEDVLRILRCAAKDWDYTSGAIDPRALFAALAQFDAAYPASKGAVEG